MSEFHRLIEQQIPRLRRYARALTRNRERADDLVQDTLGRALSKEQFWQYCQLKRPWYARRRGSSGRGTPLLACYAAPLS